MLKVASREQSAKLGLIKIMMMIEMIKMMIKIIIEMTLIMIKISARSRCTRTGRQARSDLEQDDDSDDSAPDYDDDDNQDQAPEDVQEAVRLLDQQ